LTSIHNTFNFYDLFNICFYARILLDARFCGMDSMSNRTFSPKAGDIKHQWYVVDATDKVLGRMASQIAQVLKGKHKPTYAPHMDMGDHVVVINIDKVRVTGAKAEKKVYHRHTGYPGGLRTTTYEQMMDEHPERILKKAVWGMLPNNRLGRQLLKKLRVYAGPDHRHEAQQPQSLEIQ
jgi:large subunit ribosomal protein L13